MEKGKNTLQVIHNSKDPTVVPEKDEGRYLGSSKAKLSSRLVKDDRKALCFTKLLSVAVTEMGTAFRLIELPCVPCDDE